MSATWITAIKEFAKQNGNQFIIPKRGSADYEKIKKLQETLGAKKAEPVETPAEKAKRRRAPKEPAVPQVAEKVEPEVKPIAKKVPAKVGVSASAVPVKEEVKEAVPIVKKTRARKVVPVATPVEEEAGHGAEPLPTPAKRIRKKPVPAVEPLTPAEEYVAKKVERRARKVKPVPAKSEEEKKMEVAKETVRRKKEAKLLIDKTKTVMTF